MSDRPFAYVCSPFRGDAESNTEQARKYCRQVFDAGYAPIAPHIFFPQFLNDDVPKEREAGMSMGAALLPLCRVLVVCGDQITAGMKQELRHAKKFGIETCAIENIPPIASLNSYRDDLTGLENLNIAMSLIEGMTEGRFKYAFGDLYIHTDSSSFFAVNMHSSFSRDDMLFRVYFDSQLQTTGASMTTDNVIKLQQESGRIHELLTLLDSRVYKLTPDNMNEFSNAIKQRDAVKDAPEKNMVKPSVIKQITEARKQPVETDKPKRGRPCKSHVEEL
jgi:hypothetical protein